MSTPESNLITEARHGSQQAFNMLITKYYRRLLAGLYKACHHEEDAKDVLQDSLLKAFRSIKTFRGQSSFYSWVYRISHNTLKDHWSLQRRRPPAEDVVVEPSSNLHEAHANLQDSNSPEALLSQNELSDKLASSLKNLPKTLRVTFKLRQRGFDYKRIATRIKIPIGTVRSRLNRANSIIREQINRYYVT
jgi:RNA polymerase sigma-70 factor (ECF subfamily)